MSVARQAQSSIQKVGAGNAKEADVQAKTRGFGILVRGSTPQEMQARLQADVAKWATVIDKTGLAKQ